MSNGSDFRFDDKKCQGYVYIKWEYWSTMLTIKHYLRHENKVNENKVLYYKALRCETNQKQQKLIIIKHVHVFS